MKHKTRLRIEYGIGCIVGLFLPPLWLFTYLIREEHWAVGVASKALYLFLWFSVFLVVSSAISVLFNILEARRRIKKKRMEERKEKVSMRKGRVVEVVERPDLIINEPEE